MPHDSYHGDSYHLGFGLRLSHVLPTERIGVCCIRCDKWRVYGHETLRAFRHDLPVASLPDVLTVFCQARKFGGECRRVIVSPDDGCSDAG